MSKEVSDGAGNRKFGGMRGSKLAMGPGPADAGLHETVTTY